MKATTIIKTILDTQPDVSYIETPDEWPPVEAGQTEHDAMLNWLLHAIGIKTVRAGVIEPNEMYILIWHEPLTSITGKEYIADAVCVNTDGEYVLMYKVE